MRNQLKYSYYKDISCISSSFPLSFLNLKRSKWIKIKKLLLLRKKLYSYVDLYLIKKNFKNWDRIKFYHKIKVNSKRFISKLYEDSFSTKNVKFKNNKLREDNILSLNLIPLSRLDILLWVLFLTESPFMSREFIKKGFIYLNNVKLRKNVVLKKGDVITVKNTHNKSYLNIKEKYVINERVFSFVEIDYYSNSFCFIKTLESAGKGDNSLVSLDYIDFQRI